MPPSGLIVTKPLISTLRSGSATSNLNLVKSAAKRHFISSRAKLCPMQLRGPCKNVTNAYGLSAPPVAALAPSSHLSGLKSAASAPQRARLRLMAHAAIVGGVPWGMDTLPIVVGTAARRGVAGAGE